MFLVAVAVVLSFYRDLGAMMSMAVYMSLFLMINSCRNMREHFRLQFVSVCGGAFSVRWNCVEDVEANKITIIKKMRSTPAGVVWAVGLHVIYVSRGCHSPFADVRFYQTHFAWLHATASLLMHNDDGYCTIKRYTHTHKAPLFSLCSPRPACSCRPIPLEPAIFNLANKQIPNLTYSIEHE